MKRKRATKKKKPQNNTSNSVIAHATRTTNSSGVLEEDNIATRLTDEHVSNNVNNEIRIVKNPRNSTTSENSDITDSSSNDNSSHFAVHESAHALINMHETTKVTIHSRNHNRTRDGEYDKPCLGNYRR